jgi:hypothetical protein
MGARAPMPRWYDIPLLWLGLQALVLAALVGVMRWWSPDLGDFAMGMLLGGAFVLVMIGAIMLKRRLIVRDEARDTSS